MNWLTYLVRPKSRDAAGAARDRGEQEWLQCPRCGHRDRMGRWRDALRVCPACDHHTPMPPPERLALLYGQAEFHAIELPGVRPDPLRFRDSKRYTERLKEAQQATGRPEGLVVCHGAIGGCNAVAAVLDPAFMDGTIGTAVGEGLVTAAQLALVQDSPLVIVLSATGPRLQEGALALLQPIRIAVALHQVRERRLPLIVVLADAGAWATAPAFTDAAHVVIGEQAGSTVPVHDAAESAGVEGSEAATPSEMAGGAAVDLIVHRRELPHTLAHLLDLLRHPRPSAEVLPLRGDSAEQRV